VAESTGAPNRFEQRRRRNRAALLEAALALFQEQGLQATKLEEICERADVSARTFFNHFETREHLYRAIARQRAEQLAQRIDALADDPSPTREQLRTLFVETGGYLAARPAYRELVAEMLSLHGEAGSEIARAGVITRAVQRFVERGVARDELTRRHPPEVLADLVLGALTIALTNWCASEDYDLKHELEHTSHALLELFP